MKQIAVLEDPIQMVVVYDGPRGLPGAQGAPGKDGADGKSFRMRGRWQTGTNYQEGDTVTWRSSTILGTDSFYILREGAPPSVVNLEPNLYPQYWAESGPADLSIALGSIWRVIQIGHNFTRIGEPVGYDIPMDRWTVAGARPEDPPALGVIAEVISPDEFVVQAVGEITGIDASLIHDSPPVWVPGRIYYLSSVAGQLQEADPGALGWRSQPVLVPTTLEPVSGLQRGVVTSWGPSYGIDAGSDPGDNPPPNPVPGALWYRKTVHVGLYVYLAQPNGSFWVQANG